MSRALQTALQAALHHLQERDNWDLSTKSFCHDDSENRICYNIYLMAKQGKVIINREFCKGCYLCVRACPVKVLAEDSESNSTGTYPAKAVQPDKCIACGNCYQVCPDVCIEVWEL